MRAVRPRSLLSAVVCVALGTLASALSLQTILGDRALAEHLMSAGLWRALLPVLGAVGIPTSDGGQIAHPALGTILLGLSVVATGGWVCGAGWISLHVKRHFFDALADWGRTGWLWWLIPGLWEGLRLAAFATGAGPLQSLLRATPVMWLAVAIAGWLATLGLLSSRPNSAGDRPTLRQNSFRVPAAVWWAAGIYTVVFVTMNWGLWFSLRIPHGDSAMYEEHLWNLTHGKGFRSYLDQGLFLGEHVQVIHLLLLPVYLLWPSQLLLELCESLALASGAIPIFWIAERLTGSRRTAVLLAIAYLLYAPMHFLDISIDIKTFRPTSFGVPALLFALDQLERRRYRGGLLLLLLALAAKEDYAIVIAPLGLWIAFGQTRFRDIWSADNRRRLWMGLAIAAGAALYLLLVVVVVIPYFRSGATVHYAQYFGELGHSPRELVQNVFMRPSAVLAKLLSLRSLVYALALLLPVGFLPLANWKRLAVGFPLFAILCLMELADGSAGGRGAMLIPFHHFHAPLIPVVFWAAAGGLGHVWRKNALPETDRGAERSLPSVRHGRRRLFAAYFVGTSALASGLFFSLGPLGITFWDSHSAWYWRTLYVPGKRAEMFARIASLIPPDARVASTDFVHPRFTHNKRSYDYSGYRRKVSGYRSTVPDDTDYIVIDTRHPYSRIKTPDQIPELRDHPDQWELLPDVTEGYFIVLKRKRPPPAP